MEKQQLETPYNANERYLYAIATRLDVLIDQLSGIAEHMAKSANVAVEDVKVEEPVAPKKTVASKRARATKEKE